MDIINIVMYGAYRALAERKVESVATKFLLQERHGWDRL